MEEREIAEEKKKPNSKKTSLKLKGDGNDWKDMYLRSAAELENFRKRTLQEKATIAENAKSDVIQEILPIIDSIASAQKMGVEGIDAVAKAIADALAKIGVEEIPGINETFDPNLHNAIMHEEDANSPANTITEEFQKGYILNGKVIRHSMVKVVN